MSLGTKGLLLCHCQGCFYWRLHPTSALQYLTEKMGKHLLLPVPVYNNSHLNIKIARDFGIFRAVSAGCRAPLLVRPKDQSFPLATRVALLGALQALYVVSDYKGSFLMANKFIRLVSAYMTFKNVKHEKNAFLTLWVIFT